MMKEKHIFQIVKTQCFICNNDMFNVYFTVLLAYILSPTILLTLPPLHPCMIHALSNLQNNNYPKLFIQYTTRSHRYIHCN